MCCNDRVNPPAHSRYWRRDSVSQRVLSAETRLKARFPCPSLMKRYRNPRTVITDRCPSYRAEMKEIGNQDRQEVGRHKNNRAENSHLPFRRRERTMSRFRRMSNLQKFVSTHASLHNHFNLGRHINRRQILKNQRNVALFQWRDLIVA